MDPSILIPVFFAVDLLITQWLFVTLDDEQRQSSCGTILSSFTLCLLLRVYAGEAPAA